MSPAKLTQIMLAWDGSNDFSQPFVEASNENNNKKSNNRRIWAQVDRSNPESPSFSTIWASKINRGELTMQSSWY